MDLALKLRPDILYRQKDGGHSMKASGLKCLVSLHGSPLFGVTIGGNSSYRIKVDLNYDMITVFFLYDNNSHYS